MSGVVMGVSALPCMPSSDEAADYLVVSVGGGEAKTGVANAIVRIFLLARARLSLDDP